MRSVQIDLGELILLLDEYGNKYANSILLLTKKSVNLHPT
jgi:hypothetical protein